MKTSFDGQFLALGDIQGRLRIYLIKEFKLVKEIQAHEQEIGCMDFTPENELELNFLATGSRERYIHVYDIKNDYNLIVRLDDHSSSVSSIKFAYLKK